MKYLLYFLILILILAILFIALGFIRSSISYECEIKVDKPVAEAWAVMSDQEKLPEWIKGFKSTELVSGTANTVGAVSKIYVVDQGREMIMEETINKIRENEYLNMTFTMDFMNMDYDISFKAVDGQTFITTKSDVKGNSMISRSIVAIMPSQMKAQEEENLNNLKQLIESNSTDYFDSNDELEDKDDLRKE